MSRKSAKEIRDWSETVVNGRDFIDARVPKGINVGKRYVIAKRLAERYEVLGFFASGGCGLILRGRDLHTENNVLIKTVLNYDIYHNARGRDREGMRKRIWTLRKQLQTERRIMVLLKNSGCNGVPSANNYVFDSNPLLAEPVDTEDGKKWAFDDQSVICSEPYLIMEQINGAPLEDLIGKGIPEQRALQIMLQVCYVLRVAHQPIKVKQNIWNLVYQDLKPANILIGEHDYVSLLDWGGCRLTINGSSDPAMSGANTPGYCPSECERIEPLTPAVDSYTVGSTLFHMLTGKAPSEFMRSTLALTKKAVSHQSWDWPYLGERVRSSTFQFVKKCLAESPVDRPSDGSAMFDALTALLD